MMKHDWQRAGLCMFCGYWCPDCNDCQCPGNGWVRYATSNCPGFDTNAGYQRPIKIRKKVS